MPSEGLKFLKEKEVMTNDEILRFVRIASKHGLRKVRITGGEPLVRRNIISLISAIKKTGICDLSITTNGIILSKVAGDLKKAGLDRVNISLDTMNPEKYRTITKGGNIDSVWQSIRQAEKSGLTPVKINVVPIRGLNDNEILSFASLTFKHDYHIRFIEFMPASCNGIWEKNICVTSEETMKRISALGILERLRFKGRGPSRNYRIRGAVGVIGFISPLSDHFCDYCNRLRLTANGEIRPCLFSNIKVDIKTPMRNGASDEEIDNLFCQAVKVKPQRHLLNENVTSASHLKAMSAIGG
jgi:cyclic pyranopterin phosphate synthase